MIHALATTVGILLGIIIFAAIFIVGVIEIILTLVKAFSKNK